MKSEPLVHEEQGVVYLFSRYWERIKKEGKNKKKFATIDAIRSVNVQFPDCSYYHRGKLGGIEFKYAKSKFFKDYRSGKGYDKIEDFCENSYYDADLPLFIIYWVDDKQKPNAKEQGIIDKYYVNFINLSKEFEPVVIEEENRLYARLKFKGHQKRFHLKVRDFPSINSELKRLKNTVIVPQKINQGYIKVLGHNAKNGASDVDIRHWKYLHMYTTLNGKVKRRDEFPIKIFFVPNNEKKVVGYIVPKYVFKITKRNRSKEKLRRFYNKFYIFPPYDEEDLDFNAKKEGYCIVYDRFVLINHGEKLFEKLKQWKKTKRITQSGWTFYIDENRKHFNELMDLK